MSLFFSESQSWRILQIILYFSLLPANHLTRGTRIGPNDGNVDDRVDDDDDGNKNKSHSKDNQHMLSNDKILRAVYELIHKSSMR